MSDKYVEKQIKALEEDYKAGRLAQAAMVYEDIINHIKSKFGRKTIKVYYIPLRYSTISKQARDVYKRMVDKIK